ASDPVALLAEARRLVRPDGAVLVSVPDLGSLEARLAGRRFAFLDVPRHLFHFDRPSLEAALARAGLEVVATKRLSVEYGPPIAFQSLLNFVTREPMFLWRVAKRGLSARGRARRRDLVATLVLGLVALAPVAIAAFLAALLGRGNALTV